MAPRGGKFVPMFARALLRASALAVVMACSSSALLAQGRPAIRLEAGWQGADIVVTAAVDDDAATPLMRATWRNALGDRPDLQWQQLSSGARTSLMLDQLVEAGISAMLDAHVRFDRTGVRSTLPAPELARAMDRIGTAAARSFGAEQAFQGLQHPTREQLAKLLALEWGQAARGIDASGEGDKYLAIYRFVRVQRDELDRQLHADLSGLAAVPVLGAAKVGARNEVRINTTCGTVFDADNFLCALDLQLADTGTGGVDPVLADRVVRALESRVPPPPPVQATGRVRKRDQWLKAELDRINDRIDRMDQRRELWELRDRLDDIEDRLTGVELELGEVRGQQQRQEDNPMANLALLTGRHITVRFGRNSVALDPEYRVLLNEVFEQLARNPGDRVLITGFTDRSGDATVNLRLSEQRAKAVRNYLLSRGIAPDRLLVNYYGDSRSMGRNPDERRVEVEWLR